MRAIVLAAALSIKCAVVCGAAGSDVPAASQNPTAWRQIALERALHSAADIADAYRHAEALAAIARVQATFDDGVNADRTVRAALTAAADITEPTFQGWVLQEIVVTQLAAGDLVGARQTADRIRSERPHGSAWAAIAMVQLRGGDVAGAQATTARIRDAGAAGEVQRQIVLTRIASGALSAARELALQIKDGFCQAQALGDVAAADVRAGNAAAAEALARRSRKSQRPEIYGRIALAKAEAGDLNGAITALPKIDDELERAILQGRIAALRAAAGDRTQAQRFFTEAMSTLDAAQDRNHRKAITWSQLARIQWLAGERTGATQCLRRAISHVSDMPAGLQRDEALDVIARNQASMDEGDAALITAAGISDRVTRALLIRDVVASQPDSQAASALMHNLPEATDAVTRAAALFGVLGTQLLRKDQVRRESEVIAATIEAAREAVRLIDDAQLKPAAFAALAAAQATIGDTAAGDATFAEALNSAAILERPEQRSAACVQIIKALDERWLFPGPPASVHADRRNF